MMMQRRGRRTDLPQLLIEGLREKKENPRNTKGIGNSETLRIKTEGKTRALTAVVPQKSPLRAQAGQPAAAEIPSEVKTRRRQVIQNTKQTGQA